MSENNKPGSPGSKFGNEPTNVRRASRARNRTVLLTPEATEEMRSQLSGATSTQPASSPASGGFGGGFSRPAQSSGFGQDLPPSSAPAVSGPAAQPVFRSTQANRGDFGTRKTDTIFPEQVIQQPMDDRLDFSSEPDFSEPVSPAPESSSSFAPPSQVFSRGESNPSSSVAVGRDSSLDEINRRLKNLSAPVAEPTSEAPAFSRPVAPPAAPQSATITSAAELFGSRPAVAASPVSARPPVVPTQNEFAALPVEEPEEIEGFSNDFAAFDTASWEQPVAATSNSVETVVPEEVAPSAEIEESEFFADSVEEVEEVNSFSEVPLVEETEIIEEQEEMVSTAIKTNNKDQDIVWSKETPLVGFLISLNEENYGRYYELHAGRLVITSEPVAGGSFLLLRNDSVSPMHAVLRIGMNGSLQILDQLSESGTKVLRFDNGQEVELSGDKAALNHGDVIVLGECIFSVCLISLRDQEG